MGKYLLLGLILLPVIWVILVILDCPWCENNHPVTDLVGRFKKDG